MIPTVIIKYKNNGGLGQLHPKEIDLIRRIRTEYRFGLVEIQTADGLPKQIIQTVKRQLLDEHLTD